MTEQILKNNLKIVIDVLIKSVASNSPKTLLKTDLRGKVFIIEGVLRLFTKFPFKKMDEEDLTFFEESLIFIKELEDALGAYSLPGGIKQYARGKVSGKKIKLMRGNLIQAEKNFMTYLNDKSVIQNLKATQSRMNQVDWPRNDKKTFIKTLNKEISRIDRKINKKLTPLILKDKYTTFDVEQGVHEWRRMIRWVSIYVQAYKEYFELKTSKKDLKSNPNLVRKFKNSPFSKFTGKEFTIDSIKYYKLSDYIQKIAVLKDKAEINLLLKKLYGIVLKEDGIESKTKTLFSKFKKERIFKDFIK